MYDDSIYITTRFVMGKRVRVTVSIESSVLDVFKRMAKISGLSVSRTLGDWCAQTADGAGVVAKMYSDAKGAPGRVLADMHARAVQAQTEIEWEQEQHTVDGGERDRVVGRLAAVSPIQDVAGQKHPRLVIRGETSPQKRGK